MIPRALPGYDELRAAPELAALAVLAAALVVARTALLVENPEVGEIGAATHRRAPPLCSVLATLLVARADELCDLLSWYRAAVDDLRRQRDDDDIPF